METPGRGWGEKGTARRPPAASRSGPRSGSAAGRAAHDGNAVRAAFMARLINPALIVKMPKPFTGFLKVLNKLFRGFGET